MIESVHLRGYRATQVSHVIALAGVSRRAFYEQFANKEDCFLGTYDMQVARTRKRMQEAWVAERGWANRMRAALEALLDEEGSMRNGTHLVLVDSLGIGSQGRERMLLTGFAFERLLAAAFAGAPREGGLHPLTSRAVVGGLRHLMFERLRVGDQRLMSAEEIQDWIESYRLPAGVGMWTVGDGAQLSVAPQAAAFLIREDERSRLLGAAFGLILDQGYAQLTAPNIAAHARFDLSDFRRCFVDREACFLAILEGFAEEALATAKPHLANASSWPEGVQSAIAAFVDYLFAHRSLLRLAFIDLFEVGPATIDWLMRPIEGLTALLTDVGPAPRHAPNLSLEAVTGAVWNIVSSFATRSRSLPRETAISSLTFYVLAPYIGPKDAIETIRMTHPHVRAT